MNSPAEPPSNFFDLDMQTTFGRLRGRMGLPSGGMRLSELAWNLLPLDDQLVAMGVARGTGEQAGGRTVSCAQGCGACCRQLVPLSPAEAWMIADLVRSFPDQRREAVLTRFAHTRDAALRSGIVPEISLPEFSESATKGLARDYFRLGLPCPFLEDESCSIYPNRPSICREYLVTTPAVLCMDPGRNRIEAVPVPLRLTHRLSELCALLLGRAPCSVPLPMAVEWAAEHWEDGQRRWDPLYLFNTLCGLLRGSPPVPD